MLASYMASFVDEAPTMIYDFISSSIKSSALVDANVNKDKLPSSHREKIFFHHIKENQKHKSTKKLYTKDKYSS